MLAKLRDEATRKRVFEIIQIGKTGDAASKFFDVFISVVIVTNILSLFLLTFEALEPYFPLLRMIEILTVGIFIVEYILRIWTADLLYPNLTRGKAILRFLRSFDGVIDLLTILPLFFLSGFVVFRMLRVVRIFHLFRINAYYDSFHVITSVFLEKKNQIISSVFIIFVLMIAASLCMYSAEHDAQPEVFENALSGLWWSVATVFTIGYGDIYPVTVLGRVMAVIITFLGVGAVAIPTGIISAGFVEQYTRMKQRDMEQPKTQVTMMIEEGSPYAGRSIAEIESEYSLNVAVVVRQGAILLPTDNITLQAGDSVVLEIL